MPPKLPWFPFYGRDFFEDEKVKAMSHAQVGMYLELLQHQWIEGSVTEEIARHYAEQRAVADTDRVKSRSTLFRIVSRHCTESLAVLKSCFTLLDTTGTRYMNTRLERIRAEQLEKEAKRHAKCVKGGQQRQAQLRAQHPPQVHLSHSESESEAEAETSLPKGFSSSEARTSEVRKPRPRSAIDLIEQGLMPDLSQAHHA